MFHPLFTRLPGLPVGESPKSRQGKFVRIPYQFRKDPKCGSVTTSFHRNIILEYVRKDIESLESLWARIRSQFRSCWIAEPSSCGCHSASLPTSILRLLGEEPFSRLGPLTKRTHLDCARIEGLSLRHRGWRRDLKLSSNPDRFDCLCPLFFGSEAKPCWIPFCLSACRYFPSMLIVAKYFKMLKNHWLKPSIFWCTGNITLVCFCCSGSG